MKKAQQRPEVFVCRDAQELAEQAAERIILESAQAIQQRGRFTLVLSGGSTPEKTYSLLAQPGRLRRMDWSKTFLFFGDERFVPSDDPRGNYHMARRALISQVPIPHDHVFRMPTNLSSPAEGAAAYARALAEFFSLRPHDAPPAFDLILLGLGDDGHTASLFPGAPALQEDRAWVTWSPPGTLPPPVDRITMTFPVLNAARQVLFLVAGEKKALPLRDVLGGHIDKKLRPAAGVNPLEGKLAWLIDEAAASLLKPAS